jgi:hypothetical protein
MAKKRERHWSWVDHDPGYEPEFARTPDCVEHQADFETMRYVWTASFTNRDSWAESDTSRASRHYEIRRDGVGWSVRLVGRNNSVFEVPHEWEPAPPVLAKAWDDASKSS